MKSTKPPENKNMTEIIKTKSSQDKLASNDDFCYMNQNNLTLKSIGVSPVDIYGVVQHSHASNAKGKLKNVLNVYKENSSAAHVLDIEIEKPPPIYDRDAKNKAEELDKLHAAIKE